MTTINTEIDAVNDPTKEACQLSAFLKHADLFRGAFPDIDPFVVMKIDGVWLPVRAGVKDGELENAVSIEVLDLRTPAQRLRHVLVQAKIAGLALDEGVAMLQSVFVQESEARRAAARSDRGEIVAADGEIERGAWMR